MAHEHTTPTEPQTHDTTTPTAPVPELHSLADWKRFLAMAGATVQVTRNDWSDARKTIHPITPRAGYWEPKQVTKLQSNGVYFSNGWLAFPKAAHVRFDGSATVTLCMAQDGSFGAVLCYRCWLEPSTREYRVRVVWADGGGEEVRVYQASTAEEALCMAERADAGGREAGYTLEGEEGTRSVVRAGLRVCAVPLGAVEQGVPRAEPVARELGQR